MATNSYFRQLYETNDTADQQLAEDLIIEMILIYGTDFYYLPRNIKNFDKYFGEDSSASIFEDAYTLEFYPESFTDWLGEGTFIGQWGLETRDEATVVCSIKRFNEEITAQDPELIRPREGDIIVFPLAVDNSLRFFEISFVKNEEIFYALGKIYVYTLRVKSFQYSGEFINTGVEVIDKIERDNFINMSIDLEPGLDIFVPGETVYLSSGWSAVVNSHILDKLVVGRLKGEFDELLDITGDSGVRTPLRIDNPVDKLDNLFDNRAAEDSDIIDNSETNPMLR